jgi:flagellar hook-basal body complex protein FliE
MIVPAIGALASELSLSHSASLPKGVATTGAEALPASLQTGGAEAASAGEGSFGSALTNAISSLESTQKSSDVASQALATGATKDPESSVVTVEDAQMAMDLASQVRTKATEAVQSIFNTQV